MGAVVENLIEEFKVENPKKGREQMRRVINLVAVAEKFARDRNRIKLELSLKGAGEKVILEIERILESGDNDKIFHLRLFLDAICFHSPSRQNLLRFRLGPELIAKLSGDNFKF